jgi:hypothetical protein
MIPFPRLLISVPAKAACELARGDAALVGHKMDHRVERDGAAPRRVLCVDREHGANAKIEPGKAHAGDVDHRG